MNKITSIILILFLSLLSSPSWSETLTMDDLVERDGLYYKKFTDVPFIGEVTGNIPFTGEIEHYYENGKLRSKKNYKYQYIKHNSKTYFI